MTSRLSPILLALTLAVASVAAQADNSTRAQLESMFSADQSLRLKIDSLERDGGNAATVESLWAEQARLDAANIERLLEIIETEGWSKASSVGPRAALTAWAIVQHADPDTQRRLLPMLRQAAAAGEMKSARLALLEDRVLIADGKAQRYGTQLHRQTPGGPVVLHPIDDEPHVDERRAAVGLGPLAEYLKQWGIEYQTPARP